MQAVPLPEAGEVSEDPGKLPEPDKVTKAYFEVRLRCTAQHCCVHSSPWPWADALFELAVLLLEMVGRLSCMYLHMHMHIHVYLLANHRSAAVISRRLWLPALCLCSC